MPNYFRFLIGGIALLVTASCATTMAPGFDQPSIELAGIRPLQSSGMEARFQVSLRVINPNSFALDVDGVYYEIYLRERKVLSGASSQATAIPAYGEGMLEVTASASMFESIGLLSDLVQTPPRDGLPYTLKTKISMSGLGPAVRLTHTGTIGAAR